MPTAQEMFDDLIKTLHKIDDAVVDWIASTPASSADEVAQVKRAIDLHGSLLLSVSQLRLTQYQGAASALADPQQRLTALVARIEKTTKAITDAKEVVAIAAVGVAIAVQIIALL